MRALGVLTAVSAMLWAMPAQATLWVLNISAMATGTYSTNQWHCTGNPADCVVIDSGPLTLAYSQQILVNDFADTLDFSYDAPLATGITVLQGFAGWGYKDVTGTINFDGKGFFGEDLTLNVATLSTACTAGPPCIVGQGSIFAPKFSVQFVRALDGPSPAPEPITWVLMILGFGGIGAILRAKPATTAGARP